MISADHPPRFAPAVAGILIFASIIACAVPASADPPLQSLCIDERSISVSGVSSGGFMANQFHIAHSGRVMGAAIFAAGPYLCAGTDYPESLARALAVCSHFGPGPFLGPPNPQRSIVAVEAAAATHAIDDPAALRTDNVFLFSGTLDELVPSSVVDTLADLYRAFVDERRVAYVKNVATAHAMVTASYGNACGTSRNPFVNNCGFDLAGTALRHIYGSFSPPTAANGKIVRFDQTEYVGRDVVHGLDERGYLYVPSGCTTDARCRLHIAFHGCLQNAEAVGDAFYAHAGYNEWAEANGIVVLYPQAAPVLKRVIGMPLEWPNPQGCWDWWGFTGENYATKSGMQIGAINAMIDRLAGKTAPSAAPAPSPVCH